MTGILPALHKARAEKVLANRLKVPLVAVDVVPDGQRDLLEDAAALSAVLGGAPADDGGHVADQIAPAVLLVGQANGRDRLAELRRPVELQQADVIVEAVALELGVLQHRHHFEGLRRRQALLLHLAVDVVLAQLDQQLLLSVAREGKSDTRLFVYLSVISLRLASVIGEAVRCGDNMVLPDQCPAAPVLAALGSGEEDGSLGE